MKTRSCLFVVAIGAVIAALIGVAPPGVAIAQTLQTTRVMQQKLTESQQLLADVVTSNWAALDRHTGALNELTRQPGWDVMRLPEFAKQTVAFQRALEALGEAGSQRDQRASVAAFNGLVSSCVACHEYVARSRIAAAH